MASHPSPPSLPFDLAAAVEAERLQRAAIVSSYLATATELGKLVDRLSELHGELAAEDGLNQTLHALTFVWQHVELALHIVAQGKN
jgi:hypothetical protein